MPNERSNLNDESKQINSNEASKNDSKPPKKRGIFNRSIVDHRALMAAAVPMHEPAKNVRVEDLLVQVKDNNKIPVRRYLFSKHSNDNAKRSNSYPTIFYVSGTGFVAHETKFTAVICSHLCVELVNLLEEEGYDGCQIYVIFHRLAPEDQFPAGYEDVRDVFKYFVKDMPSFYSIDTNRVAMIGYSSGGNYVIRTAIDAKTYGWPLARQILVSPFVDLSRSLNGFEDYEEKDTAISPELVEWFIELYVPEKFKFNLRHPGLSPFWNPVSAFKDLPQTTVMLATYDRFRRDAEYLLRKLVAAGVPTTRIEEEGENHAYLWYKLEVVKKMAVQLAETFKPGDVPHFMPKYMKVHVKPEFGLSSNETNTKLKQIKNTQDNEEIEETYRAKL